MIPNPWVLLGSIVGAILLTVGAYLYGEHQQATEDQVQAQAIALAQAQQIAKIQAQAHQAEMYAQEQVGKAVHDYEQKLQDSQAIVAKLTATSSGLRKQLAAYSGGANVPPNPSGPVCAPDPRVTVLAGMAGNLGEAGNGPAEAARACAVRLEALEAWAGAVIKESTESAQSAPKTQR